MGDSMKKKIKVKPMNAWAVIRPNGSIFVDIGEEYPSVWSSKKRAILETVSTSLSKKIH